MEENSAPHPVMDRFTPATREWFAGAFSAPTPAQLGAWDTVSSGAHALVVAPTGSGKTLSAFLWALDSFIRRAQGQPELPLELPPPGKKQPARGTRVLYISPLKALGVDVERNLRSPLVGITQTARRLGLPTPVIAVGVRSGDTPANERRRLLVNPPDILITTPESLFLMLTSKARETLAEVDTVIIDEVHAVAGTKRGAHLALSLERLDALLLRPAQRIGLSATVEPHAEVARFLGGAAPVSIVAPPGTKTWDLSITVPVQDMTDLPSAAAAHDLGPASGLQPKASIWPHVEEKIVDLIEVNQSTIVFANSRRLAERLTGRLNEIHAERTGAEPPDGSAPGGRGSTAAGIVEGHPTRTTPATPAVIMAQAGSSAGAEPLLARAHHGSVSKEQRAGIEDDLKTGRLRCVVATSSLELGIDMGLVDLVIQVESPSSVASGLQRVGRAGHQVGEVSTGVFFPKHRGDLLNTTVTVERMRAGKIESLRIPANPLDILAQQTVAACALGPVEVEEWFDMVRASAPFAVLPRSAFEATLDLLAGKYPSDEFAELRPRIVWDREAGTITGRPGAQRLAVTSGGTIPDRGLFGVFLIGTEDSARGGRRVGELDEEMVYESRVGDVFALGATSWKIEDITHDKVLVSPAFGQPGKLPFWKGDTLGRPYELGRAVGAFRREVAALSPPATAARLAGIGLDPWAAQNVRSYLDAQAEATGTVPNDKTLVLERFVDELGDWRVVLHSPYGLPVHAPWALAVGARLHQRYGLDGSAMAADDGIVLRVPAMDDEPPGAELFDFSADELEDIVTREVGGSALFAARFRECAARALLLPRQNPAKRTPLWQQRQRSAQLLDVAKKYPDFPIILETVRECLADVYDLPALRELADALASRTLRLVETTTRSPSPFAQSLLFGYVAQFLYEGDSPLAERRAAALSLDPALLGELLGRAELRELLDAGVIHDVEAELQRLVPARRLAGLEGAADLLRLLGPLSAAQSAARLRPEPAAGESAGALHSTEAEALAHLLALVRSRRALELKLAGETVFAAIEDAARLRDALGVPLPMGVPLAFIEPVADPLGDLVSRHARTHGPFTAAEVAAALGLGIAVVAPALRALVDQGRVAEGEFRPLEPGSTGGLEYCDAHVLRRIRARSLAALRAEVEPVDAPTYGRFLPPWQYVGEDLRGVDGVATVIDQLSGVPIPASAWESLVLPARVPDYGPAMLDELLATGEVLFSGAGSLAGNDGWLALHLADSAPLTLARDPDFMPSELHAALLGVLGNGGGFFFRQITGLLADAPSPRPSDALVLQGLWDLVWAGWIGNDTFAPVRGLLDGGKTAHKQRAHAPRVRAPRPGRMRQVRASLAAASGLRPEEARVGVGSTAPGAAHGAGRWSLLPAPEADPTLRAHASAEYLLDRYGVLTRGSVMSEGIPGGFGQMYRVLSRLEEAGRTRRGYFIEKLGAAQFSVPATVDRLRTYSVDAALDDTRSPSRVPTAIALAATDPANPYGAALPWPVPGDEQATGHRPGRKAGALVVLLDGSLGLYLERGGKTLLLFEQSPQACDAMAKALVAVLRRARVQKLALEKVNGATILDTPLAASLLSAGFYSSPSGLRFRS
ncbi:ATP-dependent helicase [Paeniglutamicibacter cryotolerans]|uniref:ATP-dependent Lhr-like helicase n=1 Tax=Paeniglutamicibacter cryotolerans TaxID=670079 RepID=A0A839QG46_9MICC|nr:ATP-dependent helicase [Paeniglutamicibacter cryotolerans]MBB2995288.1 ATP-dependent Lhr-like helicase [Paeniglutamicibacter cryotolerans]